MAAKTQFVCSSCGYESPRWLGKCPDCGNWNTFAEVKIEKSTPASPRSALDVSTSSAPQTLSKIKSSAAVRVPTHFAELDRVLGGGIVPGSAILLSGDPGIGKSTLLLELARNIAQGKSGRRVLYVSGEESEAQIKIRAERIGVKKSDHLFIFSSGDTEQVLSAAGKLKPQLLIIDSIQTMSSAEFPGFAGSLPQLRHATSRIVSYAKKNNVPAFIIGHVTKEGEIAGPMLLSHMVDTVLYLEGEALTGTKILRAFKNRFGDTSEVGLFAMEDSGLVEISNTESFFINKNNKAVPGSCLTVVMEGTRPLLVEIQALVVPSNLSFPRRVAIGIAEKRLELLLAIMQKHLKIPLDRMDVFINVVGGLKITETAVDAAVVLACASSYKNKPLKSTVAIAEVGLLGEVKSVLNEKARMAEAKKLGLKNIKTASSFSYLSDIIKGL